MKKILRLRILVPVFLVIVSLTTYSTRNFFLHYYLGKFSRSFTEKRRAKLEFESSMLDGMNELQLRGISLVPEGKDSLIYIGEMNLEINIFSMMFGRPVIHDLFVQNVRINAVKSGQEDNFSFLLNNTKAKTDSVVTGYGLTVYQLVKGFFHSFPAEMNAQDLLFLYSDNTFSLSVNVPFMKANEDSLSGEILFEEGKEKSSMHWIGTIDRSNLTASVKVIANSNSNSVFPLINTKYNTRLAFDSLSFSLDSTDYSNGRFTLKGNADISNLVLQNPKIASEKVKIKSGEMKYCISVGEDYFMLDSSTVSKVNNIGFNPFVFYRRGDQSRIEVKLNADSINAKEFFQALPSGLFTQSGQVQAEGRLSYSMNLALDLPEPDTVIFQSSLKKTNFRILQSSITFITRVNEPFYHTVYEKGIPQRTIFVSPENPDFTPLNKISELLKNCILTSEDGLFFYHRGFNEEMFGKAIRDNIKRKKFLRGASTITMQTVKNVFLRRDKTISRKLDEAMLVWLIENNRLISKERIFEIYLNIIEWGPDIYGVAEASRFYFNKKPGDLSLEECIFLTSIIPNPKMFKYSFDKSGELKGNLSYFYKLISGILHYKEVITDEEYTQLQPKVKITGRAKNFILSPDSIPSDPSIMEPIENE